LLCGCTAPSPFGRFAPFRKATVAVALHRCDQQANALAGIEYDTTRPLPVELFAACPADHSAYLDVIRT
jgi:hypothetical protein